MTTTGYSIAEPVDRLVEEFHKLPGIGPKTAQRLTYYLVRMPEDEANSLAVAIMNIKKQIVLCSSCFNITASDPCSLCSDSERDQTRICVVEEPLDVQALERTAVFKGLYHVLHGVISPMQGIGPDDLKIMSLLDRIKATKIEEVVLATNPNLEGEATSMYINNLISSLGVVYDLFPTI